MGHPTKQPLFPDEGSGAEVVLRPGDSVIVRGASQLRGHLVGLFGNLNGEHFCVLLVINSKITLKHLCMQLLWHLVSTLATLFLHYNPHFDTLPLQVVERAQNTLHVPFHYLELRGLLS